MPRFALCLFQLRAQDIAGCEAAAKRLGRIDDPQRANPVLEARWGVAQSDVQGRLIANNRDRGVIVATDPETLAASSPDCLRTRKQVLPPHPAEGMLA